VFAPDTPFRGLLELILDDNQLNGLALQSLAGLSALAVLKLNANRIGEGGGAAAAPVAAAPPAAAAEEQPTAADGQTDLRSVERAAAEGSSLLSPFTAAPTPTWQLRGLQVLQLRTNGIASLVPLDLASHAPLLRRLDVADNDLTKLDGMEGLGRLRELVVSRNKLR